MVMMLTKSFTYIVFQVPGIGHLGFGTGPTRSHSENVLKFLPFLSIKGQNGSLNVTLSCQSTLYALSLLPRRRIIGQRHPHLKVIKQLLMHICSGRMASNEDLECRLRTKKKMATN